ncbi:MAG: hypothetical protein R6U98_36715 [Pirellulaceae bacterium]
MVMLGFMGLQHPRGQGQVTCFHLFHTIGEYFMNEPNDAYVWTGTDLVGMWSGDSFGCWDDSSKGQRATVGEAHRWGVNGGIYRSEELFRGAFLAYNDHLLARLYGVSPAEVWDRGTTQGLPRRPSGLRGPSTYRFDRVRSGQWFELPLGRAWDFSATSDAPFTSLVLPTGFCGYYEIDIGGTVTQYSPGATVDWSLESGGGITKFRLTQVSYNVERATHYPVNLRFSAEPYVRATGSFEVNPVAASTIELAPYTLSAIADNTDGKPAAYTETGDVAFFTTSADGERRLYRRMAAGPHSAANELIASTSGPFEEFLDTKSYEKVSINESGMVAFGARLDSGVSGIFKADGPGSSMDDYVTVATETETFKLLDDRGRLLGMQIAASGAVLFRADHEDADGRRLGPGFYLGVGGEQSVGDYTTLVDPVVSFTDISPVQRHENGRFLFRGTLDNGTQGLYTGVGGEESVDDYTLIADTSGPFRRFSNRTLDASGQVAFRATRDDGTKGIYVGDGNGTTISDYTIVAEEGDWFIELRDGRVWDFNAGVVTFQARLADSGKRVFLAGDGHEQTLSDYVEVSRVQLGKQPSYFSGRVDSIGTGSHANSKKILAYFDAAFGGVIHHFITGPITDNQQLLFEAMLTDGRRYLRGPIPTRTAMD